MKQTCQNVYIVDDDEAVRDAMGMLLDTENIPFKSYSSASEFLDKYSTSMSGCLILDIRMPGISGLELQQKLNNLNSTLPILFITGHGDIPMAVKAMRHGAYDFLRKPINENELLRQIKQAFEIESGIRTEEKNNQQLTKLINTLTERELQVFDCVSQGLANKVIAQQLAISERTVEVHRSHVMSKLEAKTIADLVRIHIMTSR